MSRLFIVVLISLSSLLVACDGEGSSNGGGSVNSPSSSAAGDNSSEEIDARNEAIQQDLNTGSQPDPLTTTETESIEAPIELEPIEVEDEDSLDSLDN